MLRRRGAEPQATTMESCAEDLETRLRETELEELSISDAAKEGGYSQEHLRRLVREGKLPHKRNNGSASHIRIRRCDLPTRIVYCRKNGGHSARDKQYDPEEDARDIAQRLGGLDG